MTIRYLKELIKDLPDDMRIYADDGSNGTFSDNSEFLTLIYTGERKDMCVLQKRGDFDVHDELQSMLEYALENDIPEQDFWVTFTEAGYKYTNFNDQEECEWAKEQLENYGLI